MSSDTRLQSLQKDLENLHRAQTEITEDIRSLRKKMEEKIAQVQNDYGNDISSLERKLDTTNKRVPDIHRQIEARQREVERELQKETPKKSGW